MENVNGINSVWGVLHCGVAPGGPCNETNGIGASRACPGSTLPVARSTPTGSSGTAASRPNQLRWYVDGQQFHSVSQSQVDAATWTNMTSHAGYFILLNVAMGGAFPNGVAGFGTPTAATVPGRADAGRLRRGLDARLTRPSSATPARGQGNSTRSISPAAVKASTRWLRPSVKWAQLS